MPQELLCQRIEHLGFLTLNRPQRRNALSRSLLEALGRQLKEWGEDPELRAVVLLGAGGSFCAGADLKERRGMTEAEVKAFVPLIRDTMTAVASFPRPVVAAIEGTALGGGLELAIACDLRVAAEDAVLGLPEVSLAIIPGAGGTQRLPRLIGLGAARDLILTARRVNGQEALSLGLVNRLTPPGQAREGALELAQAIAQNGPLAVAAAKRSMEGGFDLPLEGALAHELGCYEEIIPTEDRLEALAAFGEKRRPTFRGR